MTNKLIPTKKLTAKDFEWVKWTPEFIKTIPNIAIEALKKDHDEIKKIPDNERTFENTIEALEKSGRVGGEMIGRIDFLMHVSPHKNVRDAIQKALDEYQSKAIEVAYDEKLYLAVKAYAEKNEKQFGERAILLRDILKGYERMGFGLPKEKRDKFKNNSKKLAKLSIQFEKNISDYKDFITLTKEESEGLPESFLSRLQKDKKGRYIVTLQYPDIGPFMEYSPNDKKRKELANKNLHKGGKKNILILKDIISLREENAKLLGFKNHAEFVLDERMAKTPEVVFKFINDLIKKTQKKATKELDEIIKLKREITGDRKAIFEFYDGYYMSELERRKYSVDTEKIREYFPFDTVKNGLFKIYSKLFSVTFEKEERFALWHKDVEMYAIKDSKNKDIRGYFYVDLFPRDGKFSHACVAHIESGYKDIENGKEVYIAPQAGLIANFSKPSLSKPSLLSHGEVETFFHEFGHLMHSCLTRANFASQAGTRVVWDFVEAPSQMLENWVWQKETLPLLSGKFDSPKEKLPKKLLDAMLATKNHLIAYGTVRQMNVSLFDMMIHTKNYGDKLNDVYRDITKKNVGIILPKDQEFAAGFGHLIGYDAGYYSYMWSKVYAQDMFSRFEEGGLLNSKIGMEYRKKILEVGSSRDEMESVVDFLGRKPNNKAFLRELGITKK